VADQSERPASVHLSPVARSDDGNPASGDAALWVVFIFCAILLLALVGFGAFSLHRISTLEAQLANVESGQPASSDEAMTNLTPLERDCVLFNVLLAGLTNGQEPPRAVAGCADLFEKAASARALPGYTSAVETR